MIESVEGNGFCKVLQASAVGISWDIKGGDQTGDGEEERHLGDSQVKSSVTLGRQVV